MNTQTQPPPTMLVLTAWFRLAQADCLLWEHEEVQPDQSVQCVVNRGLSRLVDRGLLPAVVLQGSAAPPAEVNSLLALPKIPDWQTTPQALGLGDPSLRTVDTVVPCANNMPPYLNAQGLLVCEDCPYGYEAAPGLGACLVCYADMFYNELTAKCEACPSGSYGFWDEHTLVTGCTPCPAGTSALVAMATFASSTICSPCPAGTFSARNGSLACEICPPGTSTPGLLKFSTTTPSPPPGLLTSCATCAPGTVPPRALPVSWVNSLQNLLDQNGCLPCPPGTEWNPTTFECDWCPPGTKATFGGGSGCTICPGGFYSPGTTGWGMGANSQSSPPLGGDPDYGLALTCHECPIGHYCPAGSTRPIPCVPGTFQVAGGQATCDPCLPTTSSPPGAISCGLDAGLPCPPGSVQVSPVVIQTCADGTLTPDQCAGVLQQGLVDTEVQDVPEIICAPCAGGTFGGVPGPVIPIFSADLNLRSDPYEPVECPNLCTYPQASAEGATACTGPGETCHSVWPGTYKLQTPQGRGFCLPCPEGRYLSPAEPGRNSCERCPAGWVSTSPISFSCRPCLATGQYSSGFTDALDPRPDIANAIAASATGHCTQVKSDPLGSPALAVSGNWVGSSISLARGEAVGSANALPLASSGSLGPEGLRLLRQGLQVEEPSTVMLARCPRATEPTQGGCAVCTPGFFRASEFSTECTGCPAGNYLSLDDYLYMLGLPGLPGDDTNETWPQQFLINPCRACPPGTFSTVPGAFGTCTPCPGGQSSTAGEATGCTPCGPGLGPPSAVTPTGQQTRAEWEGSRQFRQTTQLQTWATDPTVTAAQDTCVPCQPGTYSTDGFCEPCPVDTYASGFGNSACLPCPRDESSPEGSTTCRSKECGPGYWMREGVWLPSGNRTVTECVPCRMGTASSEFDRTMQCNPCLNGTFAMQEGMSACTDRCPAQWIPSTPGALANPATNPLAATGVQCSVCPTGRYSTELSVAEALASPEGLAFHMDCHACAPGSASVTRLLSEATTPMAADGIIFNNPVLLDNYQFPATATGCAFCPPGRAAPFAGMGVCEPCTSGMGTVQMVSTLPIAYRYDPLAFALVSTAMNTAEAEGISHPLLRTPDFARVWAPTLPFNSALFEVELEVKGAEACVPCDKQEPRATYVHDRSTSFPSAPVAQTANNQQVPLWQALQSAWSGVTPAVGPAPPPTPSTDLTGLWFANLLGGLASSIQVCEYCGEGVFSGKPWFDSGRGSCAVICPAGTSSVVVPSPGGSERTRYACSDCSPGEYQAGQGATGCDTCQVSAGSPARASQCTIGNYPTESRCPPGYRDAAFGTGVGPPQSPGECERCDPNFQAVGSGEFCDSCAGNRYTVAPTPGLDWDPPAICLLCPEGSIHVTSGEGVPCEACPMGKTSPQVDIACFTCDQISDIGQQPTFHQHSPLQGQCEVCSLLPTASGFPQASVPSLTGSSYYSKRRRQALAYTGSEYSDWEHLQPYYSYPGVDDPPTPVGTYASAGSLCRPANPGFRLDFASAPSTQLPGGQTVYSFHAQVECQVGSVSARMGTSVECRACPPGRFQPSDARDTRDDGWNSCRLCPANTSRASVQDPPTVCSPCPGSSQSPPGSLACFDPLCPAGQDFNNQTQQCEDCPAGYTSLVSVGNQVCVACDPGFSTNNLPGQPACLPCAANQVAEHPGTPACTDCPAGQVPDTADVPSNTFCRRCQQATTAAQPGQATCDACQTGEWADADRTGCGVCATPGSAPLLISAEGGNRLEANYSDSCALCPRGRFSRTEAVTNVSICDLCSPTETTADEGSADQSDCIVCTAYDEVPLPSSPTVPGGPLGQTCQPCPADHISDPGQAAPCDPCGYGQKAVQQPSPPPSRRVCVNCEMGSEPNGTFPQPGCRPCVPPAVSLGGTMVCDDCSTIVNGFPNQTSQTCQSCPPGSVSPIGTSSCSQCPAGTGRNPLDDTDPNCHACPPGSKGEAGTGVCVACQAPNIAPANSSTTCTACPPDSKWVDGTTCEVCPAGEIPLGPDRVQCFDCSTLGPQFGVGPNHTCIVIHPCPTNHYWNGSVCLRCPQGSVGNNQGVCVECPPGSYYTCSPSNPDSCTCPVCPDNQYAPHPASLYCLDCEEPRVVDDTRTVCGFCPVGTQHSPYFAVLANNAVPVTSVRPGHASLAGLPIRSTSDDPSLRPFRPNSAQGLLPGLYASAFCEPCPEAYVSAGGSDRCHPCPLGNTPNDASRPVSTNPGDLPVNPTLCDACGADTAGGGLWLSGHGASSRPASGVTCDTCAGVNETAVAPPPEVFGPIPNLQSMGPSHCSACAPGKSYLNTGNPVLTSEPPAPSVPQVNVPGLVPGVYPNGSLSDGGTGDPKLKCQSCVVGTAGGGPGAMCVNCSLFFLVALVPGLPACTGCALAFPNGGHGPSADGRSCTPCPGGTFAAAGDAVCLPCPSGQGTRPGQTGALICAACLAGEAPVKGVCSPCPEGSYGTDGLTCIACVPPEGTTSTGQTACELCPAGEEGRTDARGYSPCQDCLPGTFRANDQAPGACQTCGLGTIAPDPGSTVCNACPAGTYASANHDLCINCIVINVSLASSHGLVQTAIETQVGSDSCLACLPGWAYSEPLQRCVECPAGTYRPSDVAQCVNCPAGSANPNPGRSSPCPLCVPGTSQPNPGRATCSTCEKATGSGSTLPPDQCTPDPSLATRTVLGPSGLVSLLVFLLTALL